MKAKILTMAAMAAVVALTSCNKEEGTAIEPSKYITVDAGVGSLTRATAKAFEANDQISIYAWTGSNTAVATELVVNNSINTYDGAKWTAAPLMLWADMITDHYFIGVYPTKAITDFTADSYTVISDILVATELIGRTANGTNQGIVPLTFSHIMARLDANLTFRDQWETAPAVASVAVVAKPEATVNYLTQVATAAGTASDDGIVLPQTTNVGECKYSCAGVVVPQTVNKIHVKIGTDTYTYNNSEGFALVGGKIQTVNLIVGRDQITLGSVTINDWTTGTTINGGEAQID